MSDWIKMRSGLPTNPRVVKMARVLLAEQRFMDWFRPGATAVTSDVTRDERDEQRDISVVTRIVVGTLLPTWSMVNEAAGRDGIIRHASSRDIDHTAGVPGFAKALAAVDWLEILPNDAGVRFINFEEHNSPQKERALTSKSGADRQKEYRERKKRETEEAALRDASSDGQRDATVTSQRDGREEKNREEKRDIPPTPKGVCRFEDFWSAWPKSERKQDKVKCARKWKDGGLDAEADRILADIAVKRQTQKWQGGFIEAPLVYLNGKRWEDGVTPGAGDDVDDWTRSAI